MSKPVRRLDLGSLAPAVKRGDGTIRVQGHLTKCGVFTYAKPDGSITRELRTPEEVHSEASLNSFAGIPVTNDHPPVMITAENAKQYTVGSLQGTPFADDDHVRGDLAIYDSATIKAIQRGKKQISLGYVCDLLDEPGEHPVYGKYDAKQVNIRGNHCAIVSTARAGSTARVRLDAAQLVLGGEERADHWMESHLDEEERDESGKWTSGGGGGNAANAAEHPDVAAARAKGFATGAGRPEPVSAAHVPWHQQEAAKVNASVAKHVANGNIPKAAQNATQAGYHEGIISKAPASVPSPVKKGPSAGTHAAAQGAHLENLSKSGWNVKTRGAQGPLKTPHATSPDGQTKLWFKPQAIHATSLRGSGKFGPVPSKHDFGNARSLNVDQRKVSTEQLAAMGENHRHDSMDIGTALASAEKHAKLIEMANEDLSKEAAEELALFRADAAADPADAEDDDGDSEDDDDSDPDSYDEDENMDAADPVPAPVAPADPADAPPADPDSDQRIAAHTFAIPARKEMPIHSPAATQAAMTGFGDHKFKGPDEKHAAFNRVYSKAIQFGVPRDARHAFQDTHGAKLDHADLAPLSHKDKMIELKKAKDALAVAVKRADAAEQKLAKAEGQIVSMKTDLDASKARNDEADVAAQARMDAKLDLLVLARATGATIESTMNARQIHAAVIKHVDKIDVADEKHDAYVEALFDGAVSRAKTDAVETLVGKNAIAIVRAKAEGGRVDSLDANKNDEEDFSEVAAARRLKARTESAWIPTVKEKN